ncbi:MAG: MBL fold metallo-hydrolase [Gammaproteobacteria bacterium]|nr:MBL fold metallo-hydrolase [Gammaproteobacteria bacterium]
MKNSISIFFLLFLVGAPVKGDLVDGSKMLESINKEIVNINTEQLKVALDKNPDTVLIDVRTRSEIVETGSIRMGQNKQVNRGWLEFQIGEHVTDKSTPIVVYCGQNLRSPLAAKTLTDMGYTNVKNYSDGFFKWKEMGLPYTESDRAPESLLYSTPVQVINGVYSAIGATQPSTYENAGHNNNLSFIIADDAVVVFNAGGSYLLAQSIHDEIKKVTDLPVKYVVLENAQGHAMLGSGYWKDQGSIIIAHEYASKIIKERKDDIYDRAHRRLRDKIYNTRVVMPDQTFKSYLKLDVKGRNIELLHLGASHGPADIQLWMPDEKLLISGDSAFNVRLLPILDHTEIKGWIETWDKIEALNADIIIPGHGGVTDIKTITRFTKDYLVYMYNEVMKIIDDGGELIDAYQIDVSRFKQWDTFNELSKRNAERIFRKLEFE